VSSAPGEYVDGGAPRPSRLKWFFFLSWIGIYLLAMAQSGWAWSGRHWLEFGSPNLDVINRFGAAVPRLVHSGDWHRLFLDVFIETSLIGLLFTLWIWSSFATLMITLWGPGRTWVVFVAGGSGAAFAHAAAYPEMQGAGAGPTGCIMGALGAFAVWGFANRGPMATRVRKMVIGYFIFMAILSVAFSLYQTGEVSAGGFHYAGLIGGFASGIVCLFVLGPRRASRAPDILSRGLVFLTVAAVVTAVVIQVPRAVSGAAPDHVQRYLQQISRTEFLADRLYSDIRRSTPMKRLELRDDINVIREMKWLEDWEGRDALFAYLDALLPIVRSEIADPHGFLLQVRSAYVVYRSFEQRLRAEYGEPPRRVEYWKLP